MVFMESLGSKIEWIRYWLGKQACSLSLLVKICPSLKAAKVADGKYGKL